MQGSGSQEASSSNSVRCHYDVFLSFRSDETGKTFTDHLCAALVNGGYHTFRDDDERGRSKNVISETQTAFQESSLSVIVFSKGYVSSRWCLNRLKQTMERRRTQRHHVLPVFYDIDPTEFKKQTRDNAEVFSSHEMQSEEEVDNTERWKAALREVTGLKGMVLGKRYEAVFIKDIVKEVRKRLDRPVVHVTPYLVGREDLVDKISLWVQNETSDAGIATICGIGGIGKTTIAKIVFNQNCSKFEGSCFLGNIREISAEVNGWVQLQKQLLSHLLNQKDHEIFNVDEGILKIKAAISCRRVLVVLDDLDDLDQFNTIIGMQEWFCPGSKVIITTRHEQQLKRHDICKTFQVEELEDDESLQLLSWHAFGQDHPLDSYIECSTSIVKHCNGLPLALQVLGSSLSGKTINVWESAIKKLETIADNKIQKVLRLSYDSLGDDHDKSLFLDIACFFVGKDGDYTVAVLEACGFYTAIGIQNLVDRSLLSVNANNILDMHQLLRDMGREIVRLESPEDPGRRSRVWHDNESFDVLRGKRGSEKVKGLSLDARKLKQRKHGKTLANANREESFDCSVPYLDSNSSKRHRLSLFSWRGTRSSVTINEESVETNALEKMPRLKLLQVNYIELVGAYKEFPKSLASLCWNGFPLESIPSDLRLDNLIALEMCDSRLRHNWKRGKFLQNLKILDLSHCHGLVTPPDFTGLPSLERLMLKCCSNLVAIDGSIGCLHNLLVFNLDGCENLQSLSSKICMLKALEELDLSGCSKLEELPPELGLLESLKLLYLDGTAIRQRVSIREDVMQVGPSQPRSWNTALKSWIPRKTQIPGRTSMAFLPRFLVELSLTSCNFSDDILGINFDNMPALESLELDGNQFSKLPESICNVSTLNFLSLRGCRELRTLPQLSERLINLDLSDCTSVKTVELSPIMSSVLHLHSSGCKNLVEVQGLLKLKPMDDFDRELISILGLFNLVSVESMEVEIFNRFSYGRKKGPLQVLHEYGISSLFLPGTAIPECLCLPGTAIPEWYSYHGTGPFVSFDVPPLAGHKLRGLNLCIVLGENPIQVSKRYRPESPDIVIETRKNLKKMIETRKNCKRWTYSPSFFGIAPPGQRILWLSHWSFGDKIEFGDHVTVHVNPHDTESCLLVKEFGVHLVYEAETNNKLLPVEEALYWCQTVPEPDFVMNRVKMGVAGRTTVSLGHLQRNKPFWLSPK